MKATDPISAVAAIGILALALAGVTSVRIIPTRHDPTEDRPITASGLLSQSDAMSITMSTIWPDAEPSDFHAIEPRLMTLGEARRLQVYPMSSALTTEESAIASLPVWAVAFSVEGNLGRTDLFGGSDIFKDYLRGSAGDAFVRPDGLSHGTVVINAADGFVLDLEAHSTEYPSPNFYDRILAYPSPASP